MAGCRGVGVGRLRLAQEFVNERRRETVERPILLRFCEGDERSEDVEWEGGGWN